MANSIPEYSLDLTEFDYEVRVKAFIRDSFTPFRRKQAECMVIDLMKSNKKVTWLFLDKALHKKSVGEWERYGFGLMYRKEFQAYVWKAIERDYEIDNQENNNDFYDILEDYETTEIEELPRETNEDITEDAEKQYQFEDSFALEEYLTKKYGLTGKEVLAAEKNNSTYTDEQKINAALWREEYEDRVNVDVKPKKQWYPQY